MQKTRELISSLQNRQPVATEEMTQTIDDQLILEIIKIEKLER